MQLSTVFEKHSAGSGPITRHPEVIFSSLSKSRNRPARRKWEIRDEPDFAQRPFASH